MLAYATQCIGVTITFLAMMAVAGFGPETAGQGLDAASAPTGFGVGHGRAAAEVGGMSKELQPARGPLSARQRCRLYGNFPNVVLPAPFKAWGVGKRCTNIHALSEPQS
jgi:hypothetical protein